MIPDGTYTYYKEQRFIGAGAIPIRATFKRGSLTHLTNWGDLVPMHWYPSYEAGVIAAIRRELALQHTYGGQRVSYAPIDDLGLGGAA